MPQMPSECAERGEWESNAVRAACCPWGSEWGSCQLNGPFAPSGGFYCPLGQIQWFRGLVGDADGVLGRLHGGGIDSRRLSVLVA